MKFLFFVFLSVFVQGARAEKAEKLGFQCVSRLPTTSFYLTEDGDQMVLKTVHHNGVEYMPIHEGVIVPNDFPYLEHKAKVLTRLGVAPEFRFPKAKCKSYGTGLISCSGGERKRIDGVDVEALHLVTEKNTRQMWDLKVDWVRVELSLNFAGDPPVKEISMNYATEDCQFGR